MEVMCLKERNFRRWMVLLSAGTLAVAVIRLLIGH
jgi:hypothetical protein